MARIIDKPTSSSRKGMLWDERVNGRMYANKEDAEAARKREGSSSLPKWTEEGSGFKTANDRAYEEAMEEYRKGNPTLLFPNDSKTGQSSSWSWSKSQSTQETAPHTQTKPLQTKTISNSTTYYDTEGDGLPDENEVWEKAEAFNSRLPKKKRDVNTLAGLYLKNNPEPTSPKEEIEKEKRRTNLALLSEALHLLVDTGSIIGGGNVYKRQPIAANTINESKAKQAALDADYRNRLARWREAYYNILAKDNEEYPDRTVDIFKALYNAYANAGKDRVRYNQKLTLQDKDLANKKEVATIRGKYSVAAARAGKPDKEVLVPDDNGGFIKMKQQDVEPYMKRREEVAQQEGKIPGDRYDKKANKVIKVTKEEQEAAKAKTLKENAAARARLDAMNKAYEAARKGNKTRYAPSSMSKEEVKNKTNLW